MKRLLILSLLLLTSVALFAGTPHPVYAEVLLQGGGNPVAGDFTYEAWITIRPDQVLTETSGGCSYGPPNAAAGYLVVQCGTFPDQWNPGETLRIEGTEISTGATGFVELILDTAGFQFIAEGLLLIPSGPTPPALATLVAPADGAVVPPEAVDLTWDYVGEPVDGFEVWFTESGLAGMKIAEVTPATLVWTVYDLMSATDYEWWILPFIGADPLETIGRANVTKQTSNSSRGNREKTYPADPPVIWTFSTFDPAPPPAPPIPPAGGSTTLNGGATGSGAGTTITMTPTGAAPSDPIEVGQTDPTTLGVPFPDNALDIAFTISTIGTITDPITIRIEWDYPVPTPPTGGDPVLLVNHGSGWVYHPVDLWNYDVAPYWIEFTTDELSDWVIGDGDDDPLPVTLSSFTASVIQNQFVRLDWTTQSESNMLGYKIYRSQGSLSQADFISDLIEAQNNTQTTEYFFEDHEVTPEVNYNYWLQSYDYDGSTMNWGPLSALIEEIQIPDLPQSTLLKGNFPNPFNPTTFIKFDVKENETATLYIYNMRGQLIESKMFEAGVHNYEWNADKVSSGVYFYKLQSDSYRKIKKMLLLK